jgi:hypothetical protein
MEIGITAVGVIVGVVGGWHLARASAFFSDRTSASPQQVEQILQIDRCVTSVMASLRAYEKRILAGEKLARNGSEATTQPASAQDRRSAATSSRPRGRFLPEPLDGKRLITIKREADQTIWECSNALARSTAVLEEDIVRRAHDLVDALVSARRALEEHEAQGERAEELSASVRAISQSRARFLEAARESTGRTPVSTETQNRIETLTEQGLAPSQLPRPYVDASVQSLHDPS